MGNLYSLLTQVTDINAVRIGGTSSRNRQREAALPTEVLGKMITKLEIPAPEEAHEVVYVLPECV